MSYLNNQLMEKNLSRFDLFDSMLNRLDVNPSVLTMDWLQDSVLSFVCIPAEISQNSPVRGIAGKSTSFRHKQEKKKEIASSPATPAVENLLPLAEVKETPKTKETPKREEPVSDEFLFYEKDWQHLAEKFELNSHTLSQVRCGMFAYLHGQKVVITQKTLSSQKIRNQNYIFAGIVFDLQEDRILTLQFCAYKCEHSKALRKMLTDSRFPLAEECEKMFIYQEILNQAFQKMSINFQKTEKIFYLEPECAKGKIGLFNFANGKLSSSAVEGAVADVYQVQTIKLN